MAKAHESKLAKYTAKRRFEKTSEPKGVLESSEADNLFVVQKHDASHLHYDFRLEYGGVLLSWAVPKGPSYDPKAKRLAVHVEDHPTSYARFEGTIPKGEYGGGTVITWDIGTWHPLGEVSEMLNQGELKFMLNGERLKGSWALIRMRKPEEKADNWLLIKEHDGNEIEGDADGIVEQFTDSVLKKKTS